MARLERNEPFSARPASLPARAERRSRLPRRHSGLLRRLLWSILLCVALVLSTGCDDASGESSGGDTGASDTGANDTGATDTGTNDTGVTDTGTNDTGTSDTASGDATDTGAADTGAADTGLADTADTTGHGAVTGLRIDPAQTTIDVVNGNVVPETFSAIATYEDGFEEAVAATWQFDRFDLASVDVSGTLTPTGTQGGQGELVATWEGQTASATVTIMLRTEIDDVGLSPGDVSAFDSPGSDPSGTLLYPYDQTVFARGILPPELQWEGGEAGDVYRIRLTEAYMQVVVYTTADPPSAWTPTVDQWNQLTQTNQGEAVNVDITRRGADGSVYTAMSQQWYVAQGSLKGTIYYWAVNRGRLMKIKPDGSAPEPVFDSGPATDLGTPAPANYDGTDPPWTVGSDGDRCVSCHTVSRDGNAVAAVFENKGSAPSPWGLIDLTASPEPEVTLISDYQDDTIWVALTPDASWAVSNKRTFDMELVDTATNTITASALDNFADDVADPVFSPDGKRFAFSSNVTGNYPVEYWRADLDVMDFDESTGEFTNRRQVVAGGNDVIAFPNFTPDSDWIMYQRGDYSRAKYGGDQIGHDNLYITDVAGQVGEIRLDNLNGDAYLPAHNHDLNYEPRVNPIAVGGYSWVVFMSPRDYGHRMRSTGGNPTYENRKQLWVAAVDLNPSAGQDPSHPAFWLPGQNLETINMSGYWALDPCRAEGESCEAGFECCTGFCQDDGSGQKVCVPPTGLCSEEGEACANNGDCCDDGTTPLVCLSGFCGRLPN